MVVSGGHMEAFELLCDILTERLRGRRETLPGRGHMIPRVGEPLNALLREFVLASE
jgi:hypothetical protein